MAKVFTQALPAPQQPMPAGEDMVAYQEILRELAELNANKDTPPPPAFTPDQQRARIAANNQQVNLGLLGQLSPDRNMQNVGGSVFKQALGDRQERQTNRGVQDPLTGETQIDPEYATQQREARRGRVLQQALGVEDRRLAARDRAELQQQRLEDQARNREDQIRLAASLRPGRAGADPELVELRKDVLRAQAEALGGRTAAAADKAAAGKAKLSQLAKSTRDKAAFLVHQVDLATKMVGPTTTGIVGSLARQVPGSPAFNLAKQIDTIKANIGFQELQEMRNHSPTGGALGQVAIKELDMLQATLGNLDTAQSPGQVKRMLGQVRSRMKTILEALSEEAVGRIATDMAPPAPAADVAPGAGPAAPSPVPQAAPQPGGQPRRKFNPATGKLE